MEAAFSIGDKAVYPVHGVTRVVALEQHDVAGCPLSVYILEVMDTGTKIMVPMAKAEAVGLRGLASEQDVAEVYDILRNHEEVYNDQTWNRRQREYMEKIKTGSIFEIAEVVRELCVLGKNKTLSFSERRMIDTAKGLLIQEIAVARQTTKAEVANEIDSIFAPAAA